MLIVSKFPFHHEHYPYCYNVNGLSLSPLSLYFPKQAAKRCYRQQRSEKSYNYVCIHCIRISLKCYDSHHLSIFCHIFDRKSVRKIKLIIPFTFQNFPDIDIKKSDINICPSFTCLIVLKQIDFSFIRRKFFQY